MGKEYRKRYDYHYDGHFMFRLGQLRYQKAHPPLSVHHHRNSLEFVFLEQGSQNYQIGSRTYTVKPGEVFVTYPNEQHSTGASPEEISSLYYLIVHMDAVRQWDKLLLPEESESLWNCFQPQESRIFRAGEGLALCFRQLMQAFDAPDDYFHTHVRNAFSEVLIALSAPAMCHKQRDSHSMEGCIEYIRLHSRDALTVPFLAEREGMSVSAFQKNFVRAAGISPAEYILKVKVEEAKLQLLDPERTITEIAYEYGFSSSQYFATVFKRFCYVTPSEFRKKHKG
ncbi:MAG: AraC family transcriptional regulator [Massiliimalia sp.]|jgi:AraC-like DNA-binding protein/mannose-6-phosphate isomerase-like protein (cupin superfamily)